jgi:hypothetical protein
VKVNNLSIAANFELNDPDDINCNMIFPNIISEQTQTHIQEKTPPKGRGISQLYSHEN